MIYASIYFSKIQIIQAEGDEQRRQEANKTALAAIGSRKKRKVEETVTSSLTTNTRAVCYVNSFYLIENLINLFNKNKNKKQRYIDRK